MKKKHQEAEHDANSEKEHRSRSRRIYLFDRLENEVTLPNNSKSVTSSSNKIKNLELKSITP
jgi:hypothetical protein